MKHAHDFIRVEAADGSVSQVLLPDGFDWPPPEHLECETSSGQRIFVRRISMSEITDEQIATITHVARGALYREVTP